jgi:hypothetical protein
VQVCCEFVASCALRKNLINKISLGDFLLVLSSSGGDPPVDRARGRQRGTSGDDGRACKGRRQAGNRPEPEYPAHHHRFLRTRDATGGTLSPHFVYLQSKVFFSMTGNIAHFFMAHLAGSKVCHVPLAEDLASSQGGGMRARHRLELPRVDMATLVRECLMATRSHGNA